MKNIQNSSLSMANRSLAARLAAAVAGLALLLPGAAMAQTIGTIGTETQTIDFETVPGGAPSDNLAIDTQFQATTGISFTLEGGASPLLAQVGGARTAFAGPPNNSTNDTVVDGSAADVGDFFLTDDGLVGTNAPDLIITFSDPVSSISGVVIDVDGMENFLFQALNSEGTVVGTDSVAFSDSDTDDGVLTPWGVDVGENTISSLKIISQGGLLFGLAFDNLVTVEQILGVVFDGVDLANVSVDFSPCGDGGCDLTSLDEFSFDEFTFDLAACDAGACDALFETAEYSPEATFLEVREDILLTAFLEAAFIEGQLGDVDRLTEPTDAEFGAISEWIEGRFGDVDFQTGPTDAQYVDIRAFAQALEAEYQQISEEFSRDLQQYQQDSIQLDIDLAITGQDRDDMRYGADGIESVIPELAAFVVQ